MLRLLSDDVRVVLAPDRIAGVRTKRGFAPRVIDKKLVACAQSPGQSVADGAIAGLTELVSRMGKEPGNATLVLSSRFVRFVLVPWSDNLSSPVEELAFARHCFAEIYGDAVDQWELRLSPGGIGESRVASAVDRELLNSAKDVFARSRLRIRSIQPHLMAAFNYWRMNLNGGDGMFIVAESGLYTCAFMQGGKWASLHTGTINGNLAAELPHILDRECLWCDLKERVPVQVFAPEQPEFALPAGQGWTVRPLRLRPQSGFSPLSDADYAMAMSVK